MGSANSADVAVKELVTRVGCAVISVDYRLAPENAVPQLCRRTPTQPLSGCKRMRPT